MLFLLTALIFCMLAVRSFDKDDHQLGGVFLLCSCLIPLLVQHFTERRPEPKAIPPAPIAPPNAAAATPIKSHRVGNGVKEDKTLQLLDKMNSDLKDIKEDLIVLTHMSEELRMCLTDPER